MSFIRNLRAVAAIAALAVLPGCMGPRPGLQPISWDDMQDGMSAWKVVQFSHEHALFTHKKTGAEVNVTFAEASDKDLQRFRDGMLPFPLYDVCRPGNEHIGYAVSYVPVDAKYVMVACGPEGANVWKVLVYAQRHLIKLEAW